MREARKRSDVDDPRGLAHGYLLVREMMVGEDAHAFECGIAPDGAVSS